MAAISFVIGGERISFSGIESGSLKNGCLTFNHEKGEGYLGPVGFVLKGPEGITAICTQDTRRRPFHPIGPKNAWASTPRRDCEIDKNVARIVDKILVHGMTPEEAAHAVGWELTQELGDKVESARESTKGGRVV